RLGPLLDNGGPTWTLAPLAGSPVLDAGNSKNGSAVDQRGLTRIVGSAIDIGAYEDQLAFSPPVVPSLDENTPTAIHLGALTDSDPGASSWTVSVDWGDGSSEILSPSSAGPLGALTHTYPDGPRTYTARASAEDNRGVAATGSFDVQVNNVAPTVSCFGP